MARRLSSCVALLFATGCGSDPTFFLPESAPPPLAPAKSTYDPTRCGVVTGQVTWGGELPAAPEFLFGAPSGDGNFVTRTVTGPYQPRIDPVTRGLGGAVISVRGIDPAAARPWDHPAVRVELADGAIRVRQGHSERVGFVRTGGRLEVVSREPAYHILRGRGDDFFSLALPVGDQPRTRALTRPGRVELSSGSGLYWARADLFVSDHPYWTVTDAAGRFALAQVPAGRVEVVAWHPSWLPARQERDPETGLVTRMTYGPAIEQVVAAEVPVGGTSHVEVKLR